MKDIKCPVCGWWNAWCCSCGVNYLHEKMVEKERLTCIKKI